MSIHERVTALYEAERHNIYSYVLYFGVPPGRAQELTQDTFLKLYLTMSKGEAIENPRAWLYKVAHNCALRFHQREHTFDGLGPVSYTHLLRASWRRRPRETRLGRAQEPRARILRASAVRRVIH